MVIMIESAQLWQKVNPLVNSGFLTEKDSDAESIFMSVSHHGYIYLW